MRKFRIGIGWRAEVNPSVFKTTELNPWERLGMRRLLPSVFAQDTYFTRGKPASNTSDKSSMDLGVLSDKGAKAYEERRAASRKARQSITIEPRKNGEIPKALRSARSEPC